METMPEEKNKLFWNEVAPVHYESYDIEHLKKTGSLIDTIQLEEVGDVTNKTLLHLQCHIGTDTLSWVYRGAHVTGVDFSSKSLKIAESLSRDLERDARFIHANIFDLPAIHNETYDIVYTSKGVLSWIRDIDEWARIIRHFLKPEGFFYIMEIHPVAYMFDDEKKEFPQIKYSYFGNKKPMYFEAGGPDYSNQEYIVKHPHYEWIWSLGNIFNALIQAGMEIRFFHEYDKAIDKMLPQMEEDESGWWYMPGYEGKVPFTFTLKATIKQK
jgi:ubiquinone/menaquinone biosynthesis C-methylase UbiE